MRLKKSIKVNGNIEILSGLHIGGNSDELEIGGVDNPVIKNPINGEPYIPGSSIKGKMRSQLERMEGKSSHNGEPCGCGKENCMICRVFGAHKNTKANLGPTRIIVRDAHLSEKSKNMISDLLKENKPYLEYKTENSVNRKTGTAAHPRFQERVSAGTEFDFEIILHIFDLDDEKEMKNFLFKGLEAIEDSYLGGSGSRGYGNVKFINVKVDGEKIEDFRSW